jgi:hypothetical protein
MIPTSHGPRERLVTSRSEMLEQKELLELTSTSSLCGSSEISPTVWCRNCCRCSRSRCVAPTITGQPVRYLYRVTPQTRDCSPTVGS